VKKAKKAKAKKATKKMRPAKAGKAAKKAAKKPVKAARAKKAGKKKAAKKAVPKKARVGATMALADGEPDHRCQRTLEPGVCLKFFFNSDSGKFDQPLGGERVPCSECQHFF
jgi:hypothetical protein